MAKFDGPPKSVTLMMVEMMVKADIDVLCKSKSIRVIYATTLTLTLTQSDGADSADTSQGRVSIQRPSILAFPFH